MDDVELYRVDVKTDQGMEEFQKPFYFLLNLAVGGDWTGEVDSTTILPASMYVDYVRVYQQNSKVDVVEQTQSKDRVVGYLPTWRTDNVAGIDFSKMTHTIVAFANPDVQGNLSTSISDNTLNQIVSRAHAQGTKVLISLGGGGATANYSNLVSTNPESFADKIMTFMNKYNLDGVDLDVEGGIDDVYWNHYDQFVTQLSTKCKTQGKLLTTAVATWYGDKVSSSTLQKFDFVNVMAYDYSMSGGPVAPMFFATDSLNFFENKGVAKDKLVLGVPFYGYDSTGAAYTYAQIVSNNPSASTLDSYNGISYNGETTIREKVRLSESYGGIMIWEIGQDAAGQYSLLNAIVDEMANANKATPTAAPTSTPTQGSTTQWKAGTSYSVGQIVSYEGKDYKCTIAHTAAENWTPTIVPALWQEIVK